MLNRALLCSLGVDPEEGLAFCAEDEDFYEEMLLEFLNESAARQAQLARDFDARAWDSYALCVHSVKSTSRMIGAAALSQAARDMESAAKEKNEAVLISAHPSFLRAYEDFTAKLGQAVTEG